MAEPDPRLWVQSQKPVQKGQHVEWAPRHRHENRSSWPLLIVVVAPTHLLAWIVSGASLAFPALLGAIGAQAGGANVLRATARVTFWGALAVALTAAIGVLFGTVV